jgi:hypothetical protein
MSGDHKHTAKEADYRMGRSQKSKRARKHRKEALFARVGKNVGHPSHVSGRRWRCREPFAFSNTLLRRVTCRRTDKAKPNIEELAETQPARAGVGMDGNALQEAG